MRRNMYLVGAIVALILILDQIIKIYIKTHFYPGEVVPVFGDWFVLEYTENPGMAFGTVFGAAMWHKLAWRIFRIAAIIGILYFWLQQAKTGVKREFLISIGLIVAGATGNLIDSMFYDFVFPFEPCVEFNKLDGSSNFTDCGILGMRETRHTGFLLGNVVDMFKFNLYWPDWMPWLAGREVFPAIWNVADASITTGVLLVIFRQRHYLPKRRTRKKAHPTTEQSSEAGS
ncbi:MAG: signal peptidase II [Bacteroidota bacterium]